MAGLAASNNIAMNSLKIDRPVMWCNDFYICDATTLSPERAKLQYNEQWSAGGPEMRWCQQEEHYSNLSSWWQTLIFTVHLRLRWGLWFCFFDKANSNNSYIHLDFFFLSQISVLLCYLNATTFTHAREHTHSWTFFIIAYWSPNFWALALYSLLFQYIISYV